MAGWSWRTHRTARGRMRYRRLIGDTSAGYRRCRGKQGMTHPDSEAALESATLDLFARLKWETANCYDETFGSNGTLGRETPAEVILARRLRVALEKLNPELPPEAIALAIEELTRDRSLMGAAQANREVYR